MAANTEQEMNKAVDKLNELYNSQPSSCVIYLNLEWPAFNCSGIFIHGMESGQKHIWIPDQADSRQAVSFSYLRSDIPTTQLYGSSGFIYDQTSRDINNKKLKLYCFYPFDADSVNTYYHPSATHGCGLKNTPFPSQLSGDFESCSSAGISTADQWIAKYAPFENPSYMIADSCSFSPNHIGSFLEALKVRVKKQSPYWTEIITEMWTEPEAEKLPIIAFFYLKGNDYAMQIAVSYQQDYCQMYGKFIPVVTLDLKTGSPNAFSATLAEQNAC